MNGHVNYMIPWIPTARPATGSDEKGGDAIEDAVRTNKVCYMRGVKEAISIRSANGDPWKWRRVCFRMKGDDLQVFVTSQSRLDYLEKGASGSGVMRPATNWYYEPTLAAKMTNIIFQGTEGFDWADPFLAKLDSNRINIEYDKTMSLQSGNDSGFIRTFHRWHGMNKNLYYDDDERGSETVNNPYSTDGIKGMGDYYVVDFFKSNGSPDSQVAIRYNSTLYWHEK